MSKKNERWYNLCSLSKVSEGGGMSQKDVRSVATELGIKVQCASDLSPYVGQFGVRIQTMNRKTVHKFMKRIAYWYNGSPATVLDMTGASS